MNPHRSDLDAALARIAALEGEANRDEEEIARLKQEVERLRHPDPDAARARAARRRTLVLGFGIAVLVLSATAVMLVASRRGPLSDVNAVAVTLGNGHPGVLVKGYDDGNARLDVYDLHQRRRAGSLSIGRHGVTAMAAAKPGSAWVRRADALERRALPSLDSTMVRPMAANTLVFVDGRTGRILQSGASVERCKHGLVSLAASARPRGADCKTVSLGPGAAPRVGVLGVPGDHVPVVHPLSFATMMRFVGKVADNKGRVYSFERSLKFDGRALFVSEHGGKPEKLDKSAPLTQPAFVVDPRYGVRVISLPKRSVLVAHRQGSDIVLDAVSLVDGSRRWRRTLGVVSIAACFRAGPEGPLVVVTRGKPYGTLLTLDPSTGAIRWKQRL